MKYRIEYEKHIHHPDGTYDKKIGTGVWEKVDENHKINCLPYVTNQNKVVPLTPKEIIHNNMKNLGFFTLTEGWTDENGCYNFEKILRGGVTIVK